MCTGFANFYFLVVGFLQMVPEISVTESKYFGDIYAAAVWQTLFIIIVVDLVLNGKEELQRHRSDKKTNMQPVAVLPVDGGPLQQTTWAHVTVGSIVKVYAREHFPADLLLLRGSDPPGQCWANTKPLDGETDTKLRLAPKGAVAALSSLTEADVAVAKEGASDNGAPNRLRELLKGAYVACEAPNDKVNDFSGQLYLQGQDPQILARENMLLRGCQLRNTDWALGLVVATGVDAKINYKGDGDARREQIKMSSTFKTMNADIIGVSLSLLAICLIGGCVNTFASFGETPWYMGEEEGDYSFRPDGGDASFLNFLTITMTYFLLCYQFIPISLYVTLSMVQMITRGFVVQDLTMYDEEADEPAQVRSVALLDELGQVSHIFSDKTGTLTSNLMSFRRCYLCGHEYGVGETAIAKSLRAMAEEGDKPPEVKISKRPLPKYGGCGPRAKRFVGYEEAEAGPSLFDALEGDTAEAQRHREFMLHQAINHSVLIETVGGKEELCASSPDEQAFVAAAEYFGYEFAERRSDVGELVIKDKRSGGTHVVQILEVFPYESSRKRMSIIVRLPPALVAATGGGTDVRLYCKGADSVLLERLDAKDPLSSGDVVKAMEDLLFNWAEVALRTLVWAQKEMADFDDWHKRYRAAAETPAEVAKFKAGEPNLISQLQDEAEGSLCLQGATAIEDKLQDGVPEILADLRSAGIKVWMLTGDKVGTAKNIATACNILPPTADVLEITSETFPVLGELKVADMLTAQKKVSAAPARRMSTGGGTTGGTTGPKDEIAVEAAVRDLDGKYPALKQVREALNDRVEAMAITSTSGGASDNCFVLDERAIEYLGLVCSDALTMVGNNSRSVVACRARKDQKAQMLELIKYGVPGSCCLAIGDGANDVAMIKAGNIGVGIIGKEGMEAVNNSDFAIGQFRFLRGLLLVHGRMCYRRIANVACFMFFKNIANVCAGYFYSYFTAASSMQIIPLFFVTWYNVFFSSLPVVIYGFADQDVSKDVSAEVVELYSKGLRREFYTHVVFVRWCVEAVYFGAMCALVPVASMAWIEGGFSANDGQPIDTTVLGFTIVCNVVVCVNFRFSLEQHSWTVMEAIVLLMMFLALEFFALDILTIFDGTSSYMGYYESGIDQAVPVSYKHPAFWFQLVLCMLMTLGPRLASKGYHGVVGTPAKNAMLIRKRRRADRRGGPTPANTPGGLLNAPEGREMQHTMSNLGRGYAFSENEPSAQALHANHTGSAHSLIRNTMSGAEGSVGENSNVHVPTDARAMSDRKRQKSESL